MLLHRWVCQHLVSRSRACRPRIKIERFLLDKYCFFPDGDAGPTATNALTWHTLSHYRRGRDVQREIFGEDHCHLNRILALQLLPLGKRQVGMAEDDELFELCGALVD